MKGIQKLNPLSRRERQIIDILYKLERATVGEVLFQLPDRPNYSTVRAQLRVLEEKGHVRHEEQGLKYVYVPCVPREVARRSALRHLVQTFFDGIHGKGGRSIARRRSFAHFRRGARSTCQPDCQGKKQR